MTVNAYSDTVKSEILFNGVCRARESQCASSSGEPMPRTKPCWHVSPGVSLPLSGG